MRAPWRLSSILLWVPAWTSACELPGEPVQWIADYCMLKLSTDDEVTAGDCIARESRHAAGPACGVKRKYKRSMCELLVRRDKRVTVPTCVKDPAIVGHTVRSGGVGR